MGVLELQPATGQRNQKLGQRVAFSVNPTLYLGQENIKYLRAALLIY